MYAKNKRFAIQKARFGTGLGLFALTPIEKGNFLLEYTGRHVLSKEADDLKTRYLFEIDSVWTIDGSARSNTARYINHSCDPNCEAEIEDGHVMIYACRDIAMGEELTTDYGEEYFTEFIKPAGCRCPRCVSIATSRHQ